MNYMIFLTVLILAVAAIALIWVSRGGLVSLANIAEGTHAGLKTYLVDEVVAIRYLLAKVGSDDAHCGICDAADIPIGVMDDEASAIGLPINVELLGSAESSRLMVAGAAIADGAYVVPTDGGKVITLPTDAGTYYICGRALTTAAADLDLVEVDPCVPVQRVVT